MEVIHVLEGSKNNYDSDFTIQCALLHDIIEDTNFTYEDIKEQFGEKVALGVLALTKNEHLPTKEEQIKDSLKRIKMQPPEVWVVKMADRITNLYHPPFYWNNEKILSYRDEVIYIYNELKDGDEKKSVRLLNKIEEYKNFLK